jgi:hypothetical protein
MPERFVLAPALFEVTLGLCEDLRGCEGLGMQKPLPRCVVAAQRSLLTKANRSLPGPIS